MTSRVLASRIGDQEGNNGIISAIAGGVGLISMALTIFTLILMHRRNKR